MLWNISQQIFSCVNSTIIKSQKKMLIRFQSNEANATFSILILYTNF